MKLLNLLRILEQISPVITAKLAYNHISKPKIKQIRAFEKPILNQATKYFLQFKNNNIAVYQWGKGDKIALLVHGWEGRASNFGAIIPLLLRSGFKVISFDAPSHGNSSKVRTNIFDVSELIEIFLKKNVYDLIITHSIGSVMTLMTMSKLRYKGNKLIVCTTPDKFEEYIEHTVNRFGLTIKTKKALINLIRSKTNYEPLALQASLFVKNIFINKTIFIHDKDDKIIDIENSKKVSYLMKNAKLIEIENTGHFKMLWAEKTLNLIKNHL